MSIVRTFLPAFNLNYVRAVEPFEMEDLVTQAISDATRAGFAAQFGLPLLIDFRDVSLINKPTDDFKKLIRKRLSLGQESADNPAAFVAADDSSFGMLRMYTAFAELEGVRREINTFITLDIEDAVSWIFPRLEVVSGTEADLLTAL